MPGSRGKDFASVTPLSSRQGQATSTTPTAHPIPPAAVCVKVHCETVDHWIGVGGAASPPTLSGTNAVVVKAGAAEEIWIQPAQRGAFAYLYTQAVASTGTVQVSFYR